MSSVNLCRVQLFSTPWNVAHQAPLSVAFPREEFWSGLLFPPPWDLPDPGIDPGFPALQADSLLTESGKGEVFQVFVFFLAKGIVLTPWLICLWTLPWVQQAPLS